MSSTVMSERDDTPTTRRYPRSLSDAFPDVRAHCIELPPPSFSRTCAAGHRVAYALGIIAAVVLIVIVWTK